MKKYLSILACAAVLAACNKAELQAPEALVEEGGTTVFSVSFASTKIALGDKEGTTYKALWETGDELTVMSGGSSLGTATLTSGAGTNIGTFSFPGTIADGTSVELIYNAGDIASEQSKASSERTFKTSASATAEVNGGAADFTLVHDAAIVKLSVASSALSGATVNAVILRGEGAVLSADAKDYVRVVLTDKPALSSTAREIVFSVKEADLTGSEIDVAFELTKDSEDYTLPVGFTGKKISANKVNSFTFANLSDSQCVAWYEPHDARVMSGSGYAYGEANTFFIQYKDGVYTDGTLSPVAAYPASVPISIKARGNFLKVHNPKGATFEWAKLGATTGDQYNGTGTVYTTRYADTNIGKNLGVNPTKFSFSYDDNLTVTVTNTGAFAGTPILLMVKGGKILWAWTFWNIAADGTTVAAVNVGGHQIANLAIGEASTNHDAWAAKSVDTFQPVHFYQWGRPMPIFWHTYATARFLGSGKNGAMPAIEGPVTLDYATENPVGLIIGPTKGTDILNWSSEKDGTLWGGPIRTITTSGVKTNYDPCPKGWRVADPDAYVNASKALYNGEITVTNDATTFKHGVYLSTAPGTLFPVFGYFQGKINTDDLRPATYAFSAGNGANANGFTWSNFCPSNASNQPRMWMYASSAAAVGATDGLSGTNFRAATTNRTAALPVRCEVDTDNR
ncbi:MAG: hypothetical protein IJQ93_06930 [Bacteroidales bacterium]|nr:hypothetical protein [Bacteroidales bacterium]